MKWFAIALLVTASAVFRGIDESDDEGDDGTGKQSMSRGHVVSLGVCRRNWHAL